MYSNRILSECALSRRLPSDAIQIHGITSICITS